MLILVHNDFSNSLCSFLLMQCDDTTCTAANTANLANMCDAAGACVCGADAAICVAASTTPTCLDATGTFALETVATAASTCKVQH